DSVQIQDTDTKSISYDYDAMGLREKMTMPFGDVVEYSYEDNQLNTVKWNNQQVVSNSYNGKGQLHQLTLGNGMVSTYEVENGRLNNLKNQLNNNPVSEYSYTYDLSGNALTR